MKQVINKSISSIFSTVSGNSIISMDSATTLKMSGGKKNPFQGRVTKVMKGASVMVFQNKNVDGYENMVKRRLVSEGKNPETFVLGPRVWGERVQGTPIITHKGKTYLEVIFLRPGKVEYQLDGVTIDPSVISAYIDSKEEGEQGGLNDKVYIRTFAEESITRVAINGEVFTA